MENYCIKIQQQQLPPYHQGARARRGRPRFCRPSFIVAPSEGVPRLARALSSKGLSHHAH
eukprot:scaffold22436_cov107-Isochrysis_galbana.AAC.1